MKSEKKIELHNRIYDRLIYVFRDLFIQIISVDVIRP